MKAFSDASVSYAERPGTPSSSSTISDFNLTFEVIIIHGSLFSQAPHEEATSGKTCRSGLLKISKPEQKEAVYFGPRHSLNVMVC